MSFVKQKIRTLAKRGFFVTSTTEKKTAHKPPHAYATLYFTSMHVMHL